MRDETLSVDLALHVDADYTRRLEPSEILKALREIHAR
jgi:hypothetical protein